MSLNPNPSFRRTALGLTAAAALAMGGFSGAHAQSMAANPPSGGSKVRTVSPGDCAAFLHYVVDEARAYPGKLSKTFLAGVLRFNRAGCAATDKNGPIQIITETDQDAASLRTSLMLMGKVDIFGASGVAHCARPLNGVCPTRTGANVPRVGG